MHAVIKDQRSASRLTDMAKEKASSQFSWLLGYTPTNPTMSNEWLPEEEGQRRPQCLFEKSRYFQLKSSLQQPTKNTLKNIFLSGEHFLYRLMCCSMYFYLIGND